MQPPQEASTIVHDVDAARTCAVDVVPHVDLHAVRHTAFCAGKPVKQLARAAASVGRNIEGTDDAQAAFVDIEYLLVDRESQAVRIVTVRNHEMQIAVRTQAEHALYIEI